MGSLKNYFTTTAILLFAQSEKTESVLKPITFKKKQNSLLWKKLNEKVLQTTKKTNLPYFISDENTQIGAAFGEKIVHSIQEIFDKGFDNVIVIGNDCPELNVHHLLEAACKLQTYDSVLGADFNGGAYLIGVSKSSFIPQEFEIISWQTPSVYSELQLLFSKQTISLLQPLNDCNDTFDFKKAIYKLPFSSFFRNTILSLLQKVIPINHFETSLVSYEFIILTHNKGSPIWL
ncbi:TIGR04282 family arsenosugar biosynthesis glycosyltransferase [Flavobacterium soyangense]|uniref:DUF2064 domain-containing protein n=1 Tax=Flavobacterium soyangense TaxID=2023265 RepID=A0A930UF17_9FLAO|nr:DUF2064 domain-containing protein [Flavobacterium soyangense]MBF2709589.1 DUF2064 domain-containing protein [Flavobacterium soyangense]